MGAAQSRPCAPRSPRVGRIETSVCVTCGVPEQTAGVAREEVRACHPVFGMAHVTARANSWDPSSWEHSIMTSSEQAVKYVSDDFRRQAARLTEAASDENKKGIYLALCSSIFIGASFIIKKKGLLVASQSGTRAGAGGYSYLREPLWWVGMCTMIGGEAANFAAYAYAPAIVVTPLGASTIIISAILANFFLGETLHACGVLACVLAVCGSLMLLSHAPAEAPLESVEEIWQLATQPQFLIYACCVISFAVVLMYRFAPRYGRSHLLIYVLICSLIGSLSVVSCKVHTGPTPGSAPSAAALATCPSRQPARPSARLARRPLPQCPKGCRSPSSSPGSRHRLEADAAQWEQSNLQEGDVRLLLHRHLLHRRADELPQQGARALLRVRCCACPAALCLASQATIPP